MIFATSWRRLENAWASPRRRRCRDRIGPGLRVVELEDRLLLSSAPDGLPSNLADATPIDLAADGSATLAGHIAGAGSPDFYRLDAATEGLLIAGVHSQGITTRLALIGSGGELLMQSDGISPGNPDDRIDLHLPAGTYFLEVESTSGAGDYTLTTSVTPAYSPFDPFGDPSAFNAPIAVGDFNSDGIPDVATPNFIYTGVGDGTFRSPPYVYAPSGNAFAVITGDFNGDGKTDLATANTYSGTVSVFLGEGDGTFQAEEDYPVGPGPISLVAGDFTGDGHTDLAVANQGDGTVSVLLGRGDGTFQPQVTYMVGSYPSAIAAGDFTGDGHTDLAVTNEVDGTVSILLNQGDGTFQQQRTYTVGSDPTAIVAGDFTGDGRTDLAVANMNSNNISVLLGDGDGTFQPQVTYTVGTSPNAIVAGDFTGDGHTDLATANTGSNDVSVLLGDGDGTFRPQERSAAGDGPSSLAAADFNGDGRPDLAVGNANSNSISVLLGNGDGTFHGQAPDQLPAKASPDASVAADFNLDGRPDLAAAHGVSNDISILLGNGDGTFREKARYPLGNDPSSVVAGDFNGDGRPDLAVTNEVDGTVSVLLGNGDGTFQPQVTYSVGSVPTAIVAGDFNGDGHTDLAVANEGNGTVSLLLGNGDGTFQPQITYPVGMFPTSLVAGDFNGDGHTDLAVANQVDGTVSVLLGNGDGTFQSQVTYPIGSSPASLVAGYFAGDGHLDLAAANSDGTVSVVLGDGHGGFGLPVTYPAGSFPSATIVAGSFTGDGHTDLAVANTASDTISLLRGNGDGTFQEPESFGVGTFPESLVAGDFNGDGRLDLAATSPDPNTIPVLLGGGDGTFASASRFATAPYCTPLVADLNGDGINDVLVINAAGDILYRQGRPQDTGSFDPPVTVNPGFPSRDIAFVPGTGQGPILASVDAHDDAVSLYAWRAGGFVRIGSLATGRLPAQIMTADLNHDGRDDLVVRNAGAGTLSVFFNGGPGPFWSRFSPFSPGVIIPVGQGASDVQAVDTTGSGILDLVVTNKLSGLVSVLHNWGDGNFAAPVPYRAGVDISHIDDSSGSPVVLSLETTAGVAAGPITMGGWNDLVTINPGSNTLDVLAGLGQGRFANPVAFPTKDPARVIRMADFNHDGIPDLAVLTANGLDIYLSDGHGGFLPPVSYDAGPDPYGLTITDLNHDGNPDLLVGNPFGDLLVLLGRGDGSFQPYRKTDQVITLAVADLRGNGSKDIIYADQGLDRVVVSYGTGRSAVLGDQSTGILDPQAVQLADLNGDGIPDLIVANSGSNNVLIFPGLVNGQFGPAVNGGHGYFVGTNPVGITVSNLTGDILPGGAPRLDLVVANQGSNDVSILLNQGDFRFTSGPRLRPGGSGPVSTIVGQFIGNAYPDLLVTESGSNDVRLLPGVGQGFFNDQKPIVFAVGTDPVASVVGTFDGRLDVVTVNAGSNDLTLISGFNGPDPVITTIPSGGIGPSTAFAFASGNGFDDLVVGNAANGVLALFEGGLHGLVLTSTAIVRDLPNPTDLSFAAMTGDQVLFYAATEGREAALLVALSLGGDTVSESGPPPLNDLTQLVSLQESSLALVGTLLTFTTEPHGDDLNGGPTEAAALPTDANPSGIGISVGQGLSQRGGNGRGEGPGEEAGNPEDGDAGRAPSGSSSRERLILGLDEALEEFGRENRDRFSGSPDPSPASVPPRAEPQAESSPPDRQLAPLPAPGQPEIGLRQGGSHRPQAAGRVEAIDAFLHSLGADDAPPDRPVPSRTSVSISRVAALLVASWASVVSAGRVARIRSRSTPRLSRPDGRDRGRWDMTNRPDFHPSWFPARLDGRSPGGGRS
jgi:hypothetical protein